MRFLPIILCSLACSAGFAARFELRDSVLYIDSSVREIAEYEFAERTDFHTVSFAADSRLKKIGRGAFSWCENLRQIEIPHNVTDIASHAFAYCFNLQHVNIPDKVEHIGSNTFCFCTSLTEVELPAGITELESYAFAECYALRRAVLPANNRMLGELIFSGCREMREIVEMSPVPPTFDCNSTLFDPEEAFMYKQCKLAVPKQSITLYQKAEGFSLFYETDQTD